MLPPLAIGVAMLRYRLYAIDILIRRTLVYGVLTACLALVYFGAIVGLQSFVRAFSNQTRDPLVTAISTLVIAALFSPLRRYIQTGIDHRFYRRKYDAERVLAAFGETCATKQTWSAWRRKCWRWWARPCTRCTSRSGCARRSLRGANEAILPNCLAWVLADGFAQVGDGNVRRAGFQGDCKPTP